MKNSQSTVTSIRNTLMRQGLVRETMESHLTSRNRHNDKESMQKAIAARRREMSSSLAKKFQS